MWANSADAAVGWFSGAQLVARQPEEAQSPRRREAVSPAHTQPSHRVCRLLARLLSPRQPTRRKGFQACPTKRQDLSTTPRVQGEAHPGFPQLPPFEDLPVGSDVAGQYRAAINEQLHLQQEQVGVYEQQAADLDHRARALGDQAVSTQREANQAAELAEYHGNRQDQLSEYQDAVQYHRESAQESETRAATSTLQQLMADDDQELQQYPQDADRYRRLITYQQEHAAEAEQQAREIERLGPEYHEQAAQSYGAQAEQIRAYSDEARANARQLWAASNESTREASQAQGRARAYGLLGSHFDNPAPHNSGALLLAAVTELRRVAARAQTNLDAARSARLQLQNSAAGASPQASQDTLARLEQVNQQIITACDAALRDLTTANHGMADLDQHLAAEFPG